MKAFDPRLKALLLTTMLVVSIVLLIKLWPDGYHQQLPESSALSPDSTTSLLFNRAVSDLRQRHYRQAIEGFREVLNTVPSLPEAYVNIGFAHVELKQYAQAKEAFKVALELRSGQVNAYWGLAVSLEGLCDIPAAIGAMKTYVHLAKQDDPYMMKARAALWEWEQLKATTACK